MTSFPLPENFFRCPSLRRDENLRLREIAATNTTRIFNMYQLNDGPIQWALNTDDSGLQIYEGIDPNGPKNSVVWMVFVELQATVDDVASLYLSHSTETFRENCSFAQKDVVDGLVLYTLSDPVEPWIGVRWSALRSPAPGLVKMRDTCTLESQGYFNSGDGQKGWITCFKSINMACCPDLYQSLNLVRMLFLAAAIKVVESDRPGYVRIEQVMQMDLKGNIPQWAMRLAMKGRCRDAGNIANYLREKRLSSTNFLNDAELIPKHARSRCFVCQNGFGSFTTKGQCRKCGEVVCKKCSKRWELRIAGLPAIRRVCTSCSTRSTEDLDQLILLESSEERSAEGTPLPPLYEPLYLEPSPTYVPTGQVPYLYSPAEVVSPDHQQPYCLPLPTATISTAPSSEYYPLPLRSKSNEHERNDLIPLTIPSTTASSSSSASQKY